MKKIIALTATVIISAMSANVIGAATIDSYDFKFSMKTPNDSWYEINDGQSIMALSNERSLVTVQEYVKGQPIPPALIEYSDFVEVCQTYYTVADETFMITGYVSTEEDSADIRTIIHSLHLANHKGGNTPEAESAASSKQDEKEKKAAESKATEEKTGEEKASEEGKATGTAWTVYDSNGNSLVLLEYADGTVRDINGRLFEKQATNSWTTVNGLVYYINDPTVEMVNIVNAESEAAQ